MTVPVFAYNVFMSWKVLLNARPGESRDHAEMRADRNRRKQFRRERRLKASS